MKKIHAAVWLLGVALTSAHAAEFKLGKLTVDRPYARATAAGQPVGGAFMTIANAGADDKLVSASSDVAKSVELHTMAMKGDVMQMRQVDVIELKAGQTTELKPGSYHVMLMGLKAPLTAGKSFPVKLKFEKAGELTVNVDVEAAK